MAPKKGGSGSSAPTPRANHRTYDAACQLMAAIIATNPGLKYNYEELAKLVGGGATKDMLNHRLRPIKKLAIELRASAEKNGGSAEIAKYYGQSSKRGVEKRIAEITKMATRQVDSVKKGEPGEERLKITDGGLPPKTESSLATKTEATHGAPGPGAAKGKVPLPEAASLATANKRKGPAYDEDDGEDEDDVPDSVSTPYVTASGTTDQGSHRVDNDDDDSDYQEPPTSKSRKRARITAPSSAHLAHRPQVSATTHLGTPRLVRTPLPGRARALVRAPAPVRVDSASSSAAGPSITDVSNELGGANLSADLRQANLSAGLNAGNPFVGGSNVPFLPFPGRPLPALETKPSSERADTSGNWVADVIAGEKGSYIWKKDLDNIVKLPEPELPEGLRPGRLAASGGPFMGFGFDDSQPNLANENARSRHILGRHFTGQPVGDGPAKNAEAESSKNLNKDVDSVNDVQPIRNDSQDERMYDPAEGHPTLAGSYTKQNFYNRDDIADIRAEYEDETGRCPGEPVVGAKIGQMHVSHTVSCGKPIEMSDAEWYQRMDQWPYTERKLDKPLFAANDNMPVPPKMDGSSNPDARDKHSIYVNQAHYDRETAAESYPGEYMDKCHEAMRAQRNNPETLKKAKQAARDYYERCKRLEESHDREVPTKWTELHQKHYDAYQAAHPEQFNGEGQFQGYPEAQKRAKEQAEKKGEVTLSDLHDSYYNSYKEHHPEQFDEQGEFIGFPNGFQGFARPDPGAERGHPYPPAEEHIEGEYHYDPLPRDFDEEIDFEAEYGHMVDFSLFAVDDDKDEDYVP